MLVAPGTDGVWFSEQQIHPDGVQSWIGRITPSGVVREFRARLPSPLGPGAPEDPGIDDLAEGADGNLWFIGGRSWIGRLTPGAAVSAFPSQVTAPYQAEQLFAITGGPDGNLWFTSNQETIGRITPEGAVRLLALPQDEFATDIASGPDGNLWLVLAIPHGEGLAERIATMTTAGGHSSIELDLRHPAT